MVVLPSTGDSRYHNCWIDGGTSPEYFGYTLLYWGASILRLWELEINNNTEKICGLYNPVLYYGLRRRTTTTVLEKKSGRNYWRAKVKCFFSMNKHGDYYIKKTCFYSVFRHSSNLNASPWQLLRRRNLAYIQAVCQYLQYGIEIPKPPQEVIPSCHPSLYFTISPTIFIYILLRTKFVVINFATDRLFELVDTATRSWRGTKQEA
jgi:hypothetical protein